MPMFEDKSKSRNAALYEKTRYLEMQMINEQSQILELAKKKRSKPEFNKERIALSHLSEPK